VIDEALEDPDYPLHADLTRLIPAAATATTPAGQARATLLRHTPRAIDAPPRLRAAMFSITETCDQLGNTYTATRPETPYQALWASVTPRRDVTTLEGHTGWVNALCTVPTNTGTLLASAGNDRTIRLWRPGDPQPLLAIPTLDTANTLIAFNGRLFAGLENGIITLKINAQGFDTGG
jgi:hypothetical protein